MKEKNKLKQKIHYQLYETDSVKAYLEQMAQKGWRLKELNDTLTFEKIEPQKLFYSVELFEKGTGTQEEPSSDMLEYVEYCKVAGWELVAYYGYLVVFMTARDDLVPIETDELIKYKIIKKSIWKSDVLIWLFCSIAFFFYIIFKGFAISFADYTIFPFTVFFMVKFVFSLLNMMKFFRWKNKARKDIKNFGCQQSAVLKKLKVKSQWSHMVYYTLFCFWIFITSYLQNEIMIAFISIAILVVYYGVKIIWSYLNTTGNDEEKNKQIIILSSICVFFIVFFIAAGVYSKIDKDNLESISEFNISLEELGEIHLNNVNSSSYNTSTIFASHAKCLLSAEDEKGKLYLLDYTVYKSKLPLLNFIYAFDERGLFGLSTYEKVDASAWGAKAIYKEKDGYGKTIIVFDDVVFTYQYFELDENDIAYIKEAIGVE